MDYNFDKSFEWLMESEGGYVNNPQDPGGATIWGVTKKNWEEFLCRQVSLDEFKALKPQDVKKFYLCNYWQKCGSAVFKSGLDYAVFDFAVNAGVAQARKNLQRALGCVPDGVFGTRTLTALATTPVEAVIENYTNDRIAFYESLKTFPVFGKGWVNRANKVKENALTLLK